MSDQPVSAELQACPSCRGSGYSNEVICRSPVAYRPCRECRGSGLSRPDPIAPGPGREAVRCDLRCWQSSTCATCLRQKAPNGRSLPLATAGAYCDDGCPGNRPNPRHLWDEHDDARHYTDPDGWANHVANCDICGGADDE